jgi:ABC-type uncharacterized transport system fused permease/ATPase subunit
MISAHGRELGTPGVVAKDDGDCAEQRRAQKQTQLDRVTIDEGVRVLVHQFREFLIALCLSPGRQGLALLTTGTVLVVCATAAAQVGLNAWNRPFYEAIAKRNFPAFSYQLLVFTAIAASLLVLNVAQAWLREMIKLQSREWLTRDLFGEWSKPGRPRLAGAAEIGVNPDQRIHEDARRLTELRPTLASDCFRLRCFCWASSAFYGACRARSTFGSGASASQSRATWCGVRFSMLRAVRGSLGVLAAHS